MVETQTNADEKKQLSRMVKRERGKKKRRGGRWKKGKAEGEACIYVRRNARLLLSANFAHLIVAGYAPLSTAPPVPPLPPKRAKTLSFAFSSSLHVNSH